MSKKIINDVNSCVDDSLHGFVSLYPRLVLYQEIKFVTRLDNEETHRVAILSGGGSGHEPFCAGYVGNGMLAGAVAGNIFASPPKAHILTAIRILDHYFKGGILVIIPNYTGDRLNFGLAVEQAKKDGINVDSITMGEDWSSRNNSSLGGRGMCGLTFLYKIGGEMAKRGHSLKDIKEALLKIKQNISTLGVSLQACSIPGQSKLFNILDDELELGTGVHGEAGIEKIKMTSAANIVSLILNKLCHYLNILPDSTENVIVMVNNLGSTSQLEQNIVCSEVKKQLDERKINILRMYAGPVMTSLDMAGFQISIFKVNETMGNDHLLFLDADTDAPCWMGSLSNIPLKYNSYHKLNISAPPAIIKSNLKFSKYQKEFFQCCLKNICNNLIANEIKLNNLDSGCGDGDCGTTLKLLAEGIQTTMEEINLENPAEVFHHLSHIAERRMGGTSGGLYGLFFTTMENYFSTEKKNYDKLHVGWAEGLMEALTILKKYGGAKIGDRTMIDSLEPAIETFYVSLRKNDTVMNSFIKCLEAARDGCKATSSMEAKAGRASYVNKENLTDVDAGAYAVMCILESLLPFFSKPK